MSDPAPAVDPSPAPTPPTGPRPKVTNRGRTTFAIASTNSESTEVPEFEPFIAPGPRGFPPMTGEISKDVTGKPIYFGQLMNYSLRTNSLRFYLLPPTCTHF